MHISVSSNMWLVQLFIGVTEIEIPITVEFPISINCVKESNGTFVCFWLISLTNILNLLFMIHIPF